MHRNKFVYLSLPYPPTANHLRRPATVNGKARLVNTKRAGDYYREVALHVAAQYRGRPLQGDLSVEVYVHPPDKRRRDLLNVEKALFDALSKAGVWSDDSQVVKATWTKRDVEAKGRVVVRITSEQLTATIAESTREGK